MALKELGFVISIERDFDWQLNLNKSKDFALHQCVTDNMMAPPIYGLEKPVPLILV